MSELLLRQPIQDIIKSYLRRNLQVNGFLAHQQAGEMADQILAKFKGYKSPKEVEDIKVRAMEAGMLNERERIWSRLDGIDEISLDHKDFTKRVCNLIVELKSEALKGKP